MGQSLFLSLILAVKFFRYIGLIVLWVHVIPAQAQEEKHLDDKPQDVYNPTTTLFTTQEHIQYNQGGCKSIAEDMSISGMHRFTFVQQHGNKLQHLGNDGTAVKPIFYTLPEQIGATSGFHAYDIYFRSPRQFRYYDTKSPYTKLYMMLARFYSLFADICHSRNVTPNWNLGANFRNIMTDKEWIPANPPGDRNVVAYGLDIFTYYKTDSERYQLLAHFLIMKHRVRETGGIINGNTMKIKKDTSEGKESFLIIPYMREENLLRVGIRNKLREKAESSDTRKRFHVYHQLALAERLWGYHELEVQHKKHLFHADPLTSSLEEENCKIFLGGRASDLQEAIEATTTVWNTQNELGVKSSWQDLFYNGYYRHTNIAFKHEESQDEHNLHEHYVGLRARYHLVESTDYLHLGGEYLFQGLYKAWGGYQGRIFDLACERVRYKPSFLAQCYHGYYRNWNNHFTPPTATQIRGGFRLGGSRVQLRPYASFTRVEKHIYFRHRWKRKENQRISMAAFPQQDSQHADVVALGTDLGLAFGAYIHWDSEFTFAKVLGPSARLFRLPTFLINSRLYYARTTAENNGTMETGIDMHWKSSYQADAYDPVTQQFYLQDEFNVYSYPVLDLFLNFRIKSFSAFLKFSHWNEYLFSPGYFVTPLYPGQKRAIDIGLNWSFFD